MKGFCQCGARTRHMVLISVMARVYVALHPWLARRPCFTFGGERPADRSLYLPLDPAETTRQAAGPCATTAKALRLLAKVTCRSRLDPGLPRSLI